MLLLVRRTRSLPVCRNCGFRSVRPSHSHRHQLDTLAQHCLLYPHLCEKCRRRFYRFGLTVYPGIPAAGQWLLLGEAAALTNPKYLSWRKVNEGVRRDTLKLLGFPPMVPREQVPCR